MKNLSNYLKVQIADRLKSIKSEKEHLKKLEGNFIKKH